MIKKLFVIVNASMRSFVKRVLATSLPGATQLWAFEGAGKK
jgi:hypothetical protein